MSRMSEKVIFCGRSDIPRDSADRPGREALWVGACEGKAHKLCGALYPSRNSRPPSCGRRITARACPHSGREPERASRRFWGGPAQNGGEWAQTRTLYQVASGARSPHGSRQKCPARRLSRKAGQFGRAFGMYDMAVDAILIFGFPVGVFVGYMLRDQISRARHGRYDPYLQ